MPFNGFYSRKKTLREGVPQGGVLSPTLFLIYINDIMKDMHPKIQGAMYADDLVLWRAEESIYVAKNRIQQALDVLCEWTKRWMVRLSADKTTYCFLPLTQPTESCAKNKWRMLKAGTQSHIPGHHIRQATHMETPH